MKKIVFALLAVGSLSFAWSQDFHVGGGISVFGLINFEGFVDSGPLQLSVQVGGRVADDLDFRVTFDSDFTDFFVIGTDLLYVLGLEDQAFFYIGGGADLFIINVLFFGTRDIWVFPGLHPTIGVEFRLDPLGIFVEAQPQPLALVVGIFIVKLRTGVNVHF